MPQDPEELLADWQWRVQRQTEATLELSRRMKRVDATVQSAHGDVTVTVDHAGSLSDLRLTGDALRLTPDELARLILSTCRRAQSRLAEQMTDLVAGIYGSDSPTTAFVAESYAEQFPTAPGERDR
ncbi:YbaB/EbfC family nucleoid-associated protein [Actinoplanes flavus]|uniref:YbaB/EbfC family nucleoid-associated protein n=1 Tax=Actinoplanes flavus TaxID=2820290 RepID=A0ABS3UJF2_9ACTN|nr:YbaB/EbfC family nucleoid-associated protein [Actinoplanes flavus]MBO3737898.1 YbaB/EbfC family nucleoid-associated protein [Actinoplanes flavus]